MTGFSDSEVNKDLRTISRGISLSFKLNEITDLAFDIYIDIDDVPGETKSDKARELVLYANRKGKLNDLITVLKEQRKNIKWPDIPFSEEPEQVYGGGSVSNDHSIYQVHRYSGTWKIQNSFSPWRGEVIEEPNTVSFTGKAVLIIPISGKEGSGIQVGKLTIDVNNYHATFNIVNEVQSASVDKFGTLNMHV